MVWTPALRHPWPPSGPLSDKIVPCTKAGVSALRARQPAAYKALEHSRRDEFHEFPCEHLLH